MTRLPPADLEINFLFQQIISLVRDDGRDLSLRQLAVLAVCIDAKQPQTVRGLAKHLGIAKPAVTRAADRLEAAKFVRRKPDPGDRRSVLIVPSPAGRRFHARFFEAKAARGRA